MTRELLFSVTKDDLDVQTFRAGKNGGQRGDKVETAVRIIHKESGAVGFSQDERSQSQNKRIAFKRMYQNPMFELWRKKKVYKMLTEKEEQENLEKRLDILMRTGNLKIEVKNENGEWIEANVYDQ